MSTPSLLLVGIGVLALGGALTAYCRSIIEGGVSKLRLALWRLHDDIVDGIVWEKYTDEESAYRLLNMVRRVIIDSRRITPLRLFGGYLLDRLQGAEPPRPGPMFRRLLDAETDDSMLNDQMTQLNGLVAHFVFRKTVFGRLGMIVVPLMFAVWRLVRGRTENLFEDPEELALPPIRAEVDREAKALATSSDIAFPLIPVPC